MLSLHMCEGCQMILVENSNVVSWMLNCFVFSRQGKYKAAREAYEQLIECVDIPPMLKANALRQLGSRQFLLLHLKLCN